ncbi:MAG: hypothetical protein AUG49_17385 [Catenulispora sp. 13_1_20CM_3_70_7]|nr:MAG: hypothetical protein AUG49_17385 [Catenulispora sp. 13_1_20CM_3_70_7]
MMFHLGEAQTRTVLPETTVLDVTFHGEATAQPLISQLSQTYAIDVTILGTAVEAVDGQTVGRMRIGLPGRFEDNVVQIGFLRERGLGVEAVSVSSSEAPAKRAAGPAPGPAARRRIRVLRTT